MAYVNNYQEVDDMPGRDGTGPVGAGAMTGRGFGPCAGVGTARLGAGPQMGLGLGCRGGSGRGNGFGFGRGFMMNQVTPQNSKEILEEQKRILQDQLEVIDEQLEDL